MFQFLAKNNQQNRVCEVLKGLGLQPQVEAYNGSRGVGMMVSCDTNGKSKRSIDKVLHANHVPGSVSRRNRFTIVNFDKAWQGNWNLRERFKNSIFIRVIGGKMQKGRIEQTVFCDCCGPGWDLVPV